MKMLTIVIAEWAFWLILGLVWVTIILHAISIRQNYKSRRLQEKITRLFGKTV